MPISPLTQDESTTDSILAEINRCHATHYARVGALTGGFQSGTWKLVTPDDDSAVLKWSRAHGAWTDVVLAAEAKVATARRLGYPTPAWLMAGLTTDGYVYQIQEFVPARPPERLTEPLARQLVDVVERCAAGNHPDPGTDPRSDWSQFVRERMSSRTPNSLLAEASRLGPGAAAVVKRAEAKLARLSPLYLPADDLVHGDLNLGNILTDADGNLATIVDIEALGAGSRAIDYASLWNSSADDADAPALALIRTAGEQAAGETAFAACALWSTLEYITFGAHLNGTPGTTRAVAAARRRIDLLETT